MLHARSRVILIILLLALIFSGACSDPAPTVTLPIHPKAINPEIRNNAPLKGAKDVVYRIRMPFPARELTAFYDSELQKMGFERVPVDSIFTFQWMHFNDKTGKWNKTTTPPAIYIAAWVDHKRTSKIWLYITYTYDSANTDWNVTPLVSVNRARLDLGKNQAPSNAKRQQNK